MQAARMAPCRSGCSRPHPRSPFSTPLNPSWTKALRKIVAKLPAATAVGQAAPASAASTLLRSPEAASQPTVFLETIAQIASAAPVGNSPAFHSEVPLVDALALQHAQQWRAREIVKCTGLMGSARLCSPVVALQLAEVARTKAGGLGTVPAEDLVALLQALVFLGVRPGNAVLGAIMSATQDRLEGLPGPSLATTLVSLVSLGVKPATPWLQAFEDSTRTVLQDLNCEHLSRLAWACGEIGWHPGPAWMAGFLGASQHSLQRFTPHELCELLLGLGLLLQAQPGALGTAWKHQLLQVSERMLRSLRPADLAALLRAVVALHMQPHAAWLQQAIQCSRKALQEFSPRDLVAVLNALNTLTGSQTPALASGTTPSSAEAGVGPLSWGRTQAADPGQAVLGSPQPSQVAAAVAAAAAAAGLSTQDPQGQQLSLWDRPSSVGRPWPAPEAPNPSAVSPASTGRDAATAQASMQASSGPAATAARAALEKGWIRAFLAAAEHALPRFTAQDLARLLSALAAAKARPGKAWMAAYQGVLAEKVGVLGAEDLAAVLCALSALRARIPPGLAEALLQGLETKLSLLSHAQLCEVAAAMAGLGLQPSPRWSLVFCQEAGSRFPHLSGSQQASLAKSAVALRALEVLPDAGRAWLSELLQATYSGLHAMSSASLGDLLWALSMAGHRPHPRWWARAMACVQQHVAAAQGSGLPA